ncbi:MAG: hypothetical protein AAF086_00445 [Planctomycetota bacterium]
MIDAVAAQRDAHASGLFWYTDFDAALAEAESSGRPILSLRLLGRLDTDLSCANSRFFRTVLYADTALREKLRSDYVLHWQTVRPVPVITIDMGDGRTIERTITGNSAHYVLDRRGRVVDVLPGLYAPRTFERLLDRAGGAARDLGEVESDKQQAKIVSRWHVHWLRSLDLKRISLGVERQLAAAEVEPLRDLTVSKTAVESQLVWQAVGKTSLKFDAENWQILADHYAKQSQLDAGSQQLMRSKMPAEDANNLTIGKKFIEDPFMRTLRNLEASIALDTARNEHDLHRRVHGWFAAGENLDDLAALNARVYDELFLMPEDDPWLGLVPADTYAALDGGGLSE